MRMNFRVDPDVFPSSSSYGCSIFRHLNELMFGERHANGFAKHGDMIEILMS
jgi:hypothetical protein